MFVHRRPARGFLPLSPILTYVSFVRFVFFVVLPRPITRRLSLGRRGLAHHGAIDLAEDQQGELIDPVQVFKQWPTIFNNDSTLASAILDRLLHHAESIVLEGKSRMKDRIDP